MRNVNAGLSIVGNMYSHIDDPYKDQVVLVSDAVWCQEAEMTGAIISGWKAANAVTFALDRRQNIPRRRGRTILDWWRMRSSKSTITGIWSAMRSCRTA